jgi:uncharacterized membrane protein YkvA (DUF1232 family)
MRQYLSNRRVRLTKPRYDGMRVRRSGRSGNRLVINRAFLHLSGMSELAEFVRRGAAKVSPLILKRVYKALPMLKIEFAQIDAPSFPHLEQQLQFLANVVEDFADGKADEIPYCTVAAACYAIVYARKKWDLIPDFVPDVGRADDSAVVRTVLIENEAIFELYAAQVNVNWRAISVKP